MVVRAQRAHATTVAVIRYPDHLSGYGQLTQSEELARKQTIHRSDRPEYCAAARRYDIGHSCGLVLPNSLASRASGVASVMLQQSKGYLRGQCHRQAA